MKNLFAILSVIGLIALYSCKNPCKYVETYERVDVRLPYYVFKAGTYWIYQDSINGIIDSQYVYEAAYKVHYRNPLDTPNRLYLGVSVGPGLSSDYCGPYYLDDLYMHIVSYKNGVFSDTLSIRASPYSDNAENALTYIEHHNQANGAGAEVLYLDPVGKRYGELGWQFISYLDHTTSFTSGANTFAEVDAFRILNHSPNTVRFRDTTDLYFSRGKGIVKMVDHNSAGDINWELIRWHIVH